jgi:diadenosine tetraphosphate (Ap4A) HIT family hydrolase
MKYELFLKNLNHCPFCALKPEEIIKKNKFGKVILARAPYRKDHLLVVPNKHALTISDLTKAELFGLFKLILWSEKKLKKICANLSILYREGKNAGKSINHLHIHLIPDEKIGAMSGVSKREIYGNKKYINFTTKIKEGFK